MKVTPVLFLDNIEAALAFWIERLGFTKIVEVPEGDRLGFVILESNGFEVMLQTLASLKADRGGDMSIGTGSVSLFIEVSDFDQIRTRLEGLEIVMHERVSSYGMREIAVMAPGGHAVCIAAPELPHSAN